MTVALTTIRNQIANEFLRSDINSEIDLAINAAIDFYASEPFWFAEIESSLVTTSPNTAYIPLGNETIPYIHNMAITNNNKSSLLVKISWQDYIEISKYSGYGSGAELTKGEPNRWAFFGDFIYLYPIPDKSYSVVIYYNQFPGPNLPLENEAILFFNHGRDLIKYRAKWDVAQNILHDQDQALIAKQSEEEALLKLQQKNVRKLATSTLVPTDF